MKKNTSDEYGNWPSKIKAKLIVSDSISIDEPIPCANALYYIERRPQENGRCVIVKVTNGESIDLLPVPYSARSRVHEYAVAVIVLMIQIVNHQWSISLMIVIKMFILSLTMKLLA